MPITSVLRENDQQNLDEYLLSVQEEVHLIINKIDSDKIQQLEKLSDAISNLSNSLINFNNLQNITKIPLSKFRDLFSNEENISYFDGKKNILQEVMHSLSIIIRKTLLTNKDRSYIKFLLHCTEILLNKYSTKFKESVDSSFNIFCDFKMDLETQSTKYENIKLLNGFYRLFKKFYGTEHTTKIIRIRMAPYFDTLQDLDLEELRPVIENNNLGTFKSVIKDIINLNDNDFKIKIKLADIFENYIIPYYYAYKELQVNKIKISNILNVLDENNDNDKTIAKYLNSLKLVMACKVPRSEIIKIAPYFLCIPLGQLETVIPLKMSENCTNELLPASSVNLGRITSLTDRAHIHKELKSLCITKVFLKNITKDRNFYYKIANNIIDLGLSDQWRRRQVTGVELFNELVRFRETYQEKITSSMASKTLPKIKIKQKKYVLELFDTGDPKVFWLGEITNNCISINNKVPAGILYCQSAIIKDNAGIYIVSKDDEIVAASYATILNNGKEDHLIFARWSKKLSMPLEKLKIMILEASQKILSNHKNIKKIFVGQAEFGDNPPPESLVKFDKQIPHKFNFKDYKGFSFYYDSAQGQKEVSPDCIDFNEVIDLTKEQCLIQEERITTESLALSAYGIFNVNKHPSAKVDFYIKAELPQELTPYSNSYIYLTENEKLFYLNSSGKIEEYFIDDKDLFRKKITAFDKASDKLEINKKEMKALFNASIINPVEKFILKKFPDSTKFITALLNYPHSTKNTTINDYSYMLKMFKYDHLLSKNKVNFVFTHDKLIIEFFDNIEKFYFYEEFSKAINNIFDNSMCEINTVENKVLLSFNSDFFYNTLLPQLCQQSGAENSQEMNKSEKFGMY